MDKCNRMRYFFKIKEIKYSWISMEHQDLYLLYVFILQIWFIFQECAHYFIVLHICALWVEIQNNCSNILPIV